jgi:NADH:ubiquinone oxidoreductase subunit F (NADH-binding)
MGGALARAARKWGDVRDAVSKARLQGKYLDCYVVCNGDESEPGTFKDRELLVQAPYLVVEGVLLAGLFLGAKKGIIYIRHEYGEAVRSVRRAIRRLYDTVKDDAVQSFPIEVFVSPGGYICGEQSALLQAIEDRRAQPRNAPPALEAIGLYEQPTVVNNVETLSWVPGIVLNWPKTTAKPPEPPPAKEGADAKKERKPNDEVWYARDKRRFFSISGDVKRPGVYELAFKDTLRTLIFDKNCAQGMAEGKGFKAVATSGPSGGFLPPRITGAVLQAMRERIRLAVRGSRTPERLQKFLDERIPTSVESFFTFDLELDGSFLRDLGIGLGAGIVVYGETTGKPTPMIDHALNCLHFFERESCGKCVPCRIGCQKLVDLGNKVRTAPNDTKTRAAVEQVADELAELMKITSICSLGRSAPIPLTTCLDYFTD